MDTTSINELPETMPSQNSLPNLSYSPNITATINNNMPSADNSTHPMPSSSEMNQSNGVLKLDQSAINQIVSGLQQASLNGGTKLKSKDIPTETTHLSMDPNTQLNYIPNPAMRLPQRDGEPHYNEQYIHEDDNYENILNQNIQETKYKKEFDKYLDEMQMPLIVGILFFMFQLPFTRSFMHNNLSFLFYADGNMNLNGYVLTSLFFSFIYFVLFKILN